MAKTTTGLGQRVTVLVDGKVVFEGALVSLEAYREPIPMPSDSEFRKWMPGPFVEINIQARVDPKEAR